MEMMEQLHMMCETLGNELRKANDKIQIAGGKLTAADLDYVDKLTHAIKSVKGVLMMAEQEEGGEYSGAYDGRSGRMSYDGMGRGSYRGSYDSSNRSYRRSYRRDSMGRYAGNGGLSERIREMMEDAPDDQTRQELQRLADKMDR